MTFWEHFVRLVVRRPVPALKALYWHLTRRRVRARNCLRVASADFNFAYQAWIRKHESNGDGTAEFTSMIEGFGRKPKFSVLLYSAGTGAERDRSVASLRDQVYPFWTLIDATASSISEAIATAPDDMVVPLRVGDLLSRTALLHFAEALQTNPKAAILFGDHDHLDAHGRRTRPWFKPAWNPELFLAQDYLSPAFAVEGRLARRIASDGVENLAYFLISATSLANDAIVHVPRIICHVGSGNRDGSGDERLQALSRTLQPHGASCSPGPFDTIKVEWPLPDQLPLISIIIPTKDKVHLLRSCIQSIIGRTSYKNYEILVVDDGSIERRTAAYLKEIANNPKIRVLHRSGEYNYSAINNFAVRQARGSYICLLNNDTEVIEPHWLTELMRYAVRPDVGAVGAKLLYEDGAIQHAGVMIGIGGAAGHAHRFLPGGEPGYFAMPHAAQFISAVTAACLLIGKDKFWSVGGLDEEGLRIAFSDVDLCLKVQQAGWRNVYVPHAVLLHYESKSRGLDSSPANADRFRRELSLLRERWGTEDYEDPSLNPWLDRCSESFMFNF